MLTCPEATVTEGPPGTLFRVWFASYACAAAGSELRPLRTGAQRHVLLGPLDATGQS